MTYCTVGCWFYSSTTDSDVAKKLDEEQEGKNRILCTKTWYLPRGVEIKGGLIQRILYQSLPEVEQNTVAQPMAGDYSHCEVSQPSRRRREEEEDLSEYFVFAP